MALSGGADSVAALLVLRDLAAAGDVVLAGAAHLNHQLRVEAARDEAFCRALCARLDVPLVVGHVPVAERAAAWRCSVEVAARRARYAFLDEARQALAADAIAVAHTADDQAETVLLRLLRGAGTHGLRGVLPRRGTIIRPVLECRRAELRDLLAARDQAWVEDATNADVTQPRSRVRHELLPALAERFQPAIVRVLARTADVATAEDALLERLAADALTRAVTSRCGGLRLSRVALAAEPLAVARRVVRRALVEAGAASAADLADVEHVLAVCRPGGPAAVEVAGLRVERFPPDDVLFTTGGPVAVAALPVRSLTVPGSVALPELGTGCRLVAHLPITRSDRGEGAGARLALKTSVPLPLAVRGRRPGDRLQPIGLGGTKKLQDLLVDRKVPRAERDRVPVVIDATGRIVWVVGHAADATAAAAAADDDVIVLSFERPALSGSEGT